MSETPWAPGGWRTPYRDLYHFPRLAFAWEYLRRQEKFRDQWSENFARWRKVEQQGRLQVFESDATSSNDCLFASSVDADARSATVLWNPQICPSVLHVFALPARAGGRAFSLGDSPLPATLLLTADGTQHVLLQDGIRSLQLQVTGESLLRPVALVTDTGIDAPLLAYHERSLRCLQAYHATGNLPERHFRPDPHAERLAFVLQALDGWLAGARHREIAVALYGSERVVRDWGDPRENLRDQVRYAIVRGRTLMDRGYHAFLH